MNRATRNDVQPYFRSFMIERGYHCASEANGCDYIIWIQRKWRAFERATGRLIGEHKNRPYYANDFRAWLQAQDAEHLEREDDLMVQALIEGRLGTEYSPAAIIALTDSGSSFGAVQLAAAE